MKLVHVVPHIDQEASGPSYSVPRLCQSLAARGHEVELSCLAARGEIAGVKLDLHPQWPIFGKFAVSISHARALRKKADWVDIVHNHSLWSMVNVASGLVVPGRHAKLVTSPRGTLSPWALSLSKGGKSVLWSLQRRALVRADLIHATCEAEYRDIRDNGLMIPVAIIPNGIDLPQLRLDSQSRCPRTVLFLGRIHPTKCLDRLLIAWRQLQDRHSEWRLLIAGLGDARYEREVCKLAETIGCKGVEFLGPVFGVDKSRIYYESEVYVLPSHSENFGMTVAEALAHGIPAVVSRGAPWSGLEVEGCGWWVDNELPQLTEALEAALSSPRETLKSMGTRGRDWMLRDFAWESIARQMDEVYEWLLEGGIPPQSVRVD